MPRAFALSLETLYLLRDEFTREVNTALATAAADCEARAGITGARVVRFAVELTPVAADPKDVLVAPTSCALTLPAGKRHESRRARTNKSGQMLLDFKEPEEEGAADA